MSSPTTRPQWQALKDHQSTLENTHLSELFSQDSERFQKMSLQFEELLVDFSKNRMTEDTLPLLIDLAKACQLHTHIEAMFQGEKINTTEQRAVLHTALRTPIGKSVYIDGKDVIPEVHAVFNKMAIFSDKVRNGSWVGYTGKPITDIVNIGIGGSDLGPQMVCEALYPYGHSRLTMHFVSNIDGAQIERVLSNINGETTLFIIASKTFSTIETLTNALTARAWFLTQGTTEQDIAKHFVAISTQTEVVVKFGIDPDNMFEFWDWVGGRYSVWSAIGLSIMIYIGPTEFRAFLDGAHAMDTHFRTTPFAQNIPVILALIDIWYINFWGTTTQLISPYYQPLYRLPAYLQQLVMESNGKQVHRDGTKVDLITSPVVWGEAGNNGQHAYYQFLHQGTAPLTPIDFIGTIQNPASPSHHHIINLANMLAQSEALMCGKSDQTIEEELKEGGKNHFEINELLPHKRFLGNHPSNTLLVYQLNPKILGTLIALYEHRVFVAGVIWDINSFDQWGVELGKQLAKTIETDLKKETKHIHDGSTSALIQYIRTRIGD